MDDAIVLSDDDEECIFIEESTVVNESSQKKCDSSFSFVDSVNKDRSRSDAISSKSVLDEEMDELDQLIEMQKRKAQKTDDVPSTSSENATEAPPKKRKLAVDDRQKELKELAKKTKEAEKEMKKFESMRKKEEKEKEKETRRIEREISAAINSKCELYTFCHVGKLVFDTFPGLEAEIRLLYADRKIENQLRVDGELGMRIEWRRRCVELKENEDGKSERFEYSSTQDLFAVVVAAATLKQVISADSLTDFIAEQRAGFRNGRCTMLIVCFGRLELTKHRLHNIGLEIYEQHRAQILQIENLGDLALFTAQYLRSLSRREKKRMEANKEEPSSSGGHKIQFHGEKGITVGTRDEIVTDWWSKMLSTIDRISDGQRRAILKLIPDPVAAIDKYSKMDYSDAIQEIGELVAENGRRVGPAMAHRIVKMLTDDTGTAVVD